MVEKYFSLDCLDTTKTPRVEDYDVCLDKDSLHINEQTDENEGGNRTDKVSLNVIKESGDNSGNNEGNIEHNRTPRNASGNEGHSGDSVLSSGGGSRETVVIPGPGSPAEDILAISSPLASARDQDSGVYTAEDLFRDMLSKRGKGQFLSLVDILVLKIPHFWYPRSSSRGGGRGATSNSKGLKGGGLGVL